jgi:hypothetical protein
MNAPAKPLLLAGLLLIALAAVLAIMGGLGVLMMPFRLTADNWAYRMRNLADITALPLALAGTGAVLASRFATAINSQTKT